MDFQECVYEDWQEYVYEGFVEFVCEDWLEYVYVDCVEFSEETDVVGWLEPIPWQIYPNRRQS